MVPSRIDILKNLQAEVLNMQGFKPSSTNAMLDSKLGTIRDAFPNRSFPTCAVHEFLSDSKESNTVTSGFIAGLLSALMGNAGATLWISSSRTLFPPALKSFGIAPDKFIFLDLKKESDVIWAMDEALKCGALTSVVGEIKKISFMESRRLQLAVEKSNVTGFIVRANAKNLTTTACVSRWKISSLPSELHDGLPGVGYPKWKVELLRIRNGQPGVWDIQWRHGKFKFVEPFQAAPLEQQKQAG
jgi:protein ImuA